MMNLLDESELVPQLIASEAIRLTCSRHSSYCQLILDYQIQKNQRFMIMCLRNSKFKVMSLSRLPGYNSDISYAQKGVS